MGSAGARARGTGSLGGNDAEIVRRFWSCVGARDVRGARDLTTADVTIRPILGFLFTQLEFHGHDGLAQWIAELTSPWDQFEALVEDPRELQHGVLAVVRFVAWSGGRPLDARVAMECVTRDGRIAALVGYDVDEMPPLRRGGAPGR